MSAPDWLKLVRADPREFRRRIKIDTGDGIKPYCTVCEPWQEKDFRALDPGWIRVAHRIKTGRELMRAYLERPRGHDKTSGIALMACWVLFASALQLQGCAAAADKDQAALLRHAVERLLQNNPWLGSFLVVHNWEVVNPHTKSKLEILATDAAGNYGRIDDFQIYDELTHWRKEGNKENFTALASEFPKRSNMVAVIISNTGFEGQWQWTIREEARTSPDWYFSRLDGPVASWVTPKLLAEQKRILFIGSEYARLWENQWVPGVGDALRAEDIDAAFRGTKPSRPLPGGPEIYVGGIDLGATRDHSAVVILGAVPGSGQVRLVECMSWAPQESGPEKGRVDNVAAMNAVVALHHKWRVGVWRFDPHEMRKAHLELTRRGVPMEEQPFVGRHLNTMAAVLLESFRDRSIVLYPQEDLRRDLLGLSIVQKSFGFKLEGVRDERGHCDRATALAIALPVAAEIAGIHEPVPIQDGLGKRLPGMEAFS